MDAFSARGRRFSDGKPFAKPSENGGQNVEFSAGAGRGRRIWHDMARIAENRFPHRKTVWRVAVEKPCPPGKTGSFTPFPQSFPHPRKGIFSQGKSRNAQRFSGFPFFSTPVFHPFPQLFHNLWKTLWKLWEKGLEDGGTGWVCPAVKCVGEEALCGYARLFRPHPSLARHLPHPGEGFLRLCESVLLYFLILPKSRRCL